MASKPPAGRTGGKKPASAKTADPTCATCQETDGNPTRPADEGEATGVTISSDEDRDLIETLEAEKLMPPIEVLEKMADRLHPPQSWFDEEIDDA
jgi:hypothetical protein